MKPLFLRYDNYIECQLCPHRCKLQTGKRGICGVRQNTGEKIELLTYGVKSGYALDPVEKKPLYHFFPGYNILSVGSYGCNMRCDFCQNWHISQQNPGSFSAGFPPEKILSDVLSADNNIGIAFTYNEPVIWFEYVMDVAVMVKEHGFYTVMVSNGFVNKSPLKELTGVIDAFNIDLKAFSNEFYRKLTGAELEPVLDCLRIIAGAGSHLEITTLIIPGRNDSEAEMEEEAKWIASELGEDVPLHLSRYYPMYKRNDPSTPQSTLDKLFEIASRYLRNVYLGNTMTSKGQDTYCQRCGNIITKRAGYNVRNINSDASGKCLKCGNQVYRYFSFSSPKER